MCNAVPSIDTERTRYPASTITEVMFPILVELMALAYSYQETSCNNLLCSQIIGAYNVRDPVVIGRISIQDVDKEASNLNDSASG